MILLFEESFSKVPFKKAFMYFISVMDEMGAVDEPTVKQFYIKIKKDGIFLVLFASYLNKNAKTQIFIPKHNI